MTCTEYRVIIHEIITRLQRWEIIDCMVNSPAVQNTLVGESSALKAILRQVVEVAHFTDSSVLILGESGTGKELLANLIHTLDARPDKGDLVILDCSTIVPELSGSEFFGHERGVFTGAVSSRDGVFALANGGTLFLDEIGELAATLGNVRHSVWFARPTAISGHRLKKANSAQIFITVSPAMSVIFLPCGNALKTFFRWPSTF